MEAAVAVSPGLFVGGRLALLEVLQDNPDLEGWAIVHAAQTWHRKLLGYMGRGCPKEHPEYLLAVRENQLYLNLVDADSPDFFSIEVFETALAFIDCWYIKEQRKVLIHCDAGVSRAPSLALLYLAINGDLPEDYKDAFARFDGLYPRYDPRPGISSHLRQHWRHYMTETKGLLERLYV